MPKFYLPLWFVYILILILFLLWIFNQLLLIFLLIGLAGITFFLFRRKKIFLFDNQTDKNNVLLAPVNGKIISIKKNINHDFFGENVTQIQFVIGPLCEYGIFLPAQVEIKNLKILQGENLFRYSTKIIQDQNQKNYNSTSIIFEAQDYGTIGLKLIKCILGGPPQIVVAPGDRGKALANIGYLPFGGTALLYLPKNYEILPKVNDDCIAGLTIIAGLNRLRS